MDISRVKLVATDMDGTLLNSEKQLPVNFYQVFSRLKAKGTLFAAASGRQFFNLQHEFETVKNDVVFIAENGSYVVYKEEDILVQALDKDRVCELITIARGIPDSYIILCGKKQAYVENTSPVFMENLNMYYLRKQVVNDLTLVENDQFLKIAICDLAGAEQNSYRYFKALENDLQVKVSGQIWLDLFHKDANKGRAVQVIQQRFGIDFTETMVFGDYLNDLEMMKEGYFSYAMENAHPAIKEASRFLTASNDEDGVMKVLNRLVAATV